MIVEGESFSGVINGRVKRPAGLDRLERCQLPRARSKSQWSQRKNSSTFCRLWMGAQVHSGNGKIHWGPPKLYDCFTVSLGWYLQQSLEWLSSDKRRCAAPGRAPRTGARKNNHSHWHGWLSNTESQQVLNWLCGLSEQDGLWGELTDFMWLPQTCDAKGHPKSPGSLGSSVRSIASEGQYQIPVVILNMKLGREDHAYPFSMTLASLKVGSVY